MPHKDEGRFTLFKNKRAREGRRDPHYTGQVMINGTWHWMSLWKNTGGKDSKIPGETYYAGWIGNEVRAQDEPPKDYEQEEAEDTFGDDIPF